VVAWSQFSGSIRGQGPETPVADGSFPSVHPDDLISSCRASIAPDRAGGLHPRRVLEEVEDPVSGPPEGLCRVSDGDCVLGRGLRVLKS